MIRMTRYRCPSCRGLLTLHSRQRQRSAPACGLCRCPMRRVGRLPAGPLLAVGVAVGGLVVAGLPDLIDGWASLAAGPSALPRLFERFEPAPAPAERPMALLGGQQQLFEQLALADRQWVPTAEPLPDGGTRYLYRRRLGERELTIAEIRDRIANPPSFHAERQAILTLLQTLQSAGVRLVIAEPRKSGAAGEWDHAVRTIRIQPVVLEKGTVEFAKVLNHEAIHVAQSCSAGGLRSRPAMLGLDATLHPEQEHQLRDPLYATASEEEQAMEREAYANQDRLGIGADLVRTQCRTDQRRG